MDNIIHQKVTLKCDAVLAFDMFTKNEYLQKWLTKEAVVEPKVGGKYELFWIPEDRENDSTIGCKILAIEKGKILNFEWKGPKQYKEFMNTRRPFTNVTVFFNSTGSSTEVNLIHTGWGEGENWEEARLWFDNTKQI